MKRFGQLADKRRATNARSLAAFGVSPSEPRGTSDLRIIRQGTGATIFTIGYERRGGDELASRIKDAGVEVLVDVRERAVSRKPDFRAAALQARCDEVGIDYVQIPELGSPENQRKALRETGDIKAFHRRFRAYARKHLAKPLDHLAEVAKTRPVALLCYERCHENCHRSIVAEFLADRLEAAIVAIV